MFTFLNTNAFSQNNLIADEFLWVEPYGLVLKSESINDQVALSLGKVFVAADKAERFDYGNSKSIFINDATFNFAIFEYEKNIKPLNESDRVDYLWSILWRLEPNVSAIPQVEEIISLDCPTLFIKKLDWFIKHEIKDKHKLKMAKMFKQDIEYSIKRLEKI